MSPTVAEQFSNLRLVGTLLGLLVGTFVFYRLRSAKTSRTALFFLSLFAITIISVSLFPGIVNLPAEALELRAKPGGRIITLLIASTFGLWIFTIIESSRSEKMERQIDLLVRNISSKEVDKPGRTKKTPDVCILIPALNEEENLRLLLPRIPKQIDGLTISTIVIDDGSDDATRNVSKKAGAIVVSLPFNRGGGAALRTGYDVANDLGAEIVVTMDGDGQHLPEEIDGLIKPIVENQADIVIGSRLLGEYEKDSKIRTAGVHIFSRAISVITGVTITDCSSGFRAFRLSSLSGLVLKQDQFHTAELIIDSAKRGLRIVERPITIKKRMSGKSKKGANFAYGLFFLRTVVKSWFR